MTEKRLNEIENKFRLNWIPGNETTAADAEVAIIELIAALREHSWIPVSERLPDTGHKVLIFDRRYSKEVFTGTWSGQPESGFYDSPEEYSNMKTTHWQPLPALPEAKP